MHRSRGQPFPSSLWAFLAWLGDHGWREWLRITAFIVISGAVVTLVTIGGSHVISYLIDFIR